MSDLSTKDVLVFVSTSKNHHESMLMRGLISTITGTAAIYWAVGGDEPKLARCPAFIACVVFQCLCLGYYYFTLTHYYAASISLLKLYARLRENPKPGVFRAPVEPLGVMATLFWRDGQISCLRWLRLGFPVWAPALWATGAVLGVGILPKVSSSEQECFLHWSLVVGACVLPLLVAWLLAWGPYKEFEASLKRSHDQYASNGN